LDYGAPSSGPQIGLSLNGVSLLTTAPLPATGGYQSYQETPVGTVSITASGPATLRVTTVQAGLDYVHLRFVAAAVSAADVSSRVSVSRSGFRFSRASGRFIQSVTLTNTSGSAISGPVSLVLDGLSPGTVLSNAVGLTSVTSPSGHPYLAADAGSLAPNASVTVTLSLTQTATYTTRVLAGSAVL